MNLWQDNRYILRSDSIFAAAFPIVVMDGKGEEGVRWQELTVLFAVQIFLNSLFPATDF